MFDTFVQYYMYLVKGVGFLVTPFVIGYLGRPLLRGFSYGLYETVLYYRVGATWRQIFKRLGRAIVRDPIYWILNGDTSSISNNGGSWSGIFRWSFNSEFTRAKSLAEVAQRKSK